MNWLQIAHMLAALLVLAEGLNKLERADLFAGRKGWQKAKAFGFLLAPWQWRRARIVLILKAIGWAGMCVGAAGALASPLLRLDPPAVHDFAVLGGFALLIARSRLKEGIGDWINPAERLPEIVYEADGSVNCVLVHFRAPIESGSQFQVCNTVYLRNHPHQFDGWMPIPRMEAA
jgi:hypothetical protein